MQLQGKTSIGRDAECDVQLTAGGVSRRHLEIYPERAIFVLRDLGSKNGTWVNGRSVQHCAVTRGAVLRVGDHVGVFTQHTGDESSFRQLADGLWGGKELAESLLPLRRAAATNIPIVVVGATGTGKERVARAAHEWSHRSGRFHAINCATLPRHLAEAELFGYRKGAFTSADRAALGHFRAADHGTLFLDELGELPLDLQAKLLRVLEDSAVTPIGETEPVPIDVRLVVAVQRPLDDLVGARRFREDLAARLAGLTISLPALCARRADIAPLFVHFLRQYSGGSIPKVDSKLIECLCISAWPQNVRELEQLARRLLAVHDLEPTLKRAFLPTSLQSLTARRGHAAVAATPAAPEFLGRRDQDVHGLALALRQTGGNVSAAATLLGFSRQRAYRLINREPVSEFVARLAADRDVTPESDLP